MRNQSRYLWSQPTCFLLLQENQAESSWSQTFYTSGASPAVIPLSVCMWDTQAAGRSGHPAPTAGAPTLLLLNLKSPSQDLQNSCQGFGDEQAEPPRDGAGAMEVLNVQNMSARASCSPRSQLRDAVPQAAQATLIKNGGHSCTGERGWLFSFQIIHRIRLPGHKVAPKVVQVLPKAFLYQVLILQGSCALQPHHALSSSLFKTQEAKFPIAVVAGLGSSKGGSSWPHIGEPQTRARGHGKGLPRTRDFFSGDFVTILENINARTLKLTWRLNLETESSTHILAGKPALPWRSSG